MTEKLLIFCSLLTSPPSPISLPLCKQYHPLTLFLGLLKLALTCISLPPIQALHFTPTFPFHSFPSPSKLCTNLWPSGPCSACVIAPLGPTSLAFLLSVQSFPTIP